MTSRRRKKVGAIAVAVVITLVMGACAGDDAGASQGTTKLANPTQTPAATGGAETGPAETGPVETGPAETAPPPALASAGVGTCSDGARSHLELTRVDSRDEDSFLARIKVRFEVNRSPVGHEWRIRLSHHKPTIPFPPPRPNSRVFFQGNRVASDSGVLAVEVFFPNRTGPNRTGLGGYAAYAVDKQTGQVCRAGTWI